MNETLFHRILIVDDNRAIHQDFSKVLCAKEPTELDSAAARVFGGDTPCLPTAGYKLDSAFQGKEALAMVIEARQAGNPYSLAFVDMRMPPGWDGVETISNIWREDSDIQVVICTAYSDYSWEDILDRLGHSDRLLILKKPFDVAEICQLASALTQKWSLARQANLKTAELEHIVLQRTADLRTANEELHRTNQALHKCYAIESERNHLRDSVRAMEQVVEIIGHELRTPLGCIRGISEMMMKSAAADQASVSMLEGINNTARAMAQTLDSLLDAVRLRSGLATWNWSSFDLRTVCQEAIQIVRPLPDESAVPVVPTIEPFDLAMSGDPDAVRRLLVKFLANADRHTTSGQISVEMRSTTDNQLKWIEIKVSDTGAVLAPDLVRKLGEPFALNRGVIGDNCVLGAELGIAICKSIAQAHGGSVHIQSTVAVGTTVVVRLRQDLAEPVAANRAQPECALEAVSA